METKQFSSKIATLKNANRIPMEQSELIPVEMEQHSPIAIGSNANQLEIGTHFLVTHSPILSHSRTAWGRMESIPLRMVHSLFMAIQEIGMFHSNIVILKITLLALDKKMFVSTMPSETD
jgi:hypothetical protein